DLADLVDAGLDLAAAHRLDDVPALAELGLRIHLLGDAQALQHLGDVLAARADFRIDIDDRLGCQQRALERIDRRDVRRRRRFIHRDADADARDRLRAALDAPLALEAG